MIRLGQEFLWGMSMIRIVTDTSANLVKSETDRLGIAVIPMYYYDNDKEYACMDCAAFDDVSYYNQIKRGKKIVTSQITPQRYCDFFEEFLKKGEDLLYVGMSSGISSSFSSSEIAVRTLKEEYPDRYIAAFDTRGASLGEGLLAVKAAEMALEMEDFEDEAYDPEGLYRKLEELRDRMYQVFIVDDLMHLRRTGRLSNATAIIGSLLSIKPLLKGNEKGQIVTFKSARGRKKAIQEMAAKYEELVEDPATQTVGIAHSNCEEDAKALAALISRNNPPEKIEIVKYEPVTGSHVGPGALALFFMGGSDVRLK